MSKKVFLWLNRILSIMVILTFGMAFLSACSFGETEKTYSITGYVYDEYGAVEGVEIKSELGVVYTDNQGKYSISGIKESVLIEPSMEGYKFEQVSKLITSETDDANFNACRQYTVSGYVKNNLASVPSAYVTIKSLSGEFITTTDEEGYFEGKDVAGKSTISCSVDGIDYFTQTATIDNHIVNINLTSSFTINFEFDEVDVDYLAINLLINNKEYPITEASTTFDGIYSGTVVELTSSKYMFSKPEFYINKANQVETIKANRIYSIDGTVSSGNTKIVGAKILVDGKPSALTDQNGHYELEGLVSVCNISVQYEGLNFDSVVATNKTSALNFNGTKTLTVVFDYDFKQNVDITFGEFDVEISDNNVIFNSVCYGDEIVFESEAYHFSVSSIIVGALDLIEVDCFAIYDVKLSGLEGLPADEVKILLDGQIVDQSQLANIYGSHNVSAEYLDYSFDTAYVSAKVPTANLTYKIPYDAELAVKSGSLVLSSAIATVNNSTYYADDNGIIRISGLIGSNNIVVTCEGFDSQSVEVSESNNKQKSVNLTYTVHGTVKTGSVFVSGATVLVFSEAGEFSTETNANGTYTVSNVYGTTSVIVSKDYFKFTQNQQTDMFTFDFDSTYKIFGHLTITNKQGEEAPCTSVLVILVTENQRFTFDPATATEIPGYYEFNDISGRCGLITQSKDTSGVSELNPESYEITSGGEYNFNNKGYSLSGVITSGGLPVAGVYVQVAGTTGTLTDELGRYSFELVTGECEIILQKEGYSFGSKIVISDAEDKKEINFEATYTISGVVASGIKNIADVEVWANNNKLTETDENGNFSVSGLSGLNVITFVKEGYRFDAITVSNAGNHQVNGLIKATISVKTGDNFVNDYVISVWSNSQNVSGNSIELFVNYGDIVEFEKEGYKISALTVNEPNNYIVSASYSISGKVVSGDVEISNVKISYNNKFVVTDAEGCFEIEGLEGEIVLTFEKTDYNFETITVHGYKSDLNVVAKYSVTGTVYVGAKPLEGVLVKLGELTATTNSEGNFIINNVSGRFALTFKKDGYTFSQVENAFGTMPLVVSAYYSISGRITSGDLPVALANISLSIANSTKKLSAVTDSEGYFTITGISGNSSIIISKEGYNSVSLSDFDDVTYCLNVDLTYNFTLKFNVTDVVIWVGTTRYNPTNSKSITLRDLKGEVEISFEKSNTTFSQSGVIVSSIKVNAPGEEELVATVSYTVSGRVTTASNSIPVAGVTLKAGAKTATTDINGYYRLDGVAGGLAISSKYFTAQTRSISKDDDNFNFTVSDKEFAYMLYDNAYKNLNLADYVQIFGQGPADATPGGIGAIAGVQHQNTTEIYIRDKAGNVLRQNLNHGAAVQALGIDPRVSLLTYFDASTQKWSYQKVTGDAVHADGTADFGNSFSSTDGVANPLGYSLDVFAYTPYLVSGINSFINNPTVEWANFDGEQCYKFTLSLNPSKSGECKRYVEKIKATSGQDVDRFVEVAMQFYVDKKGWIRHVYIDENYYVTTSSTNVHLWTHFDYYAIKEGEYSSPNARRLDVKAGNSSEILSTLAIPKSPSEHTFNLLDVKGAVIIQTYGKRKEGSL